MEKVSGGEEVMRDASIEEEDILQRSTERTKGSHDVGSAMGLGASSGGGEVDVQMGAEKKSYKDSVAGESKEPQGGSDDMEDDGDASDDDVMEEGDEPWFGMGMTRAEKIEARRPWRNSLIIKLVGRTTGYHYLWMRFQAMWRTGT